MLPKMKKIQLMKNIRLMKNIGSLLLITVLAALFLPGCENPIGDDTEDQVKYVIGMSQANLGEPWRVVIRNV